MERSDSWRCPRYRVEHRHPDLAALIVGFADTPRGAAARVVSACRSLERADASGELVVVDQETEQVRAVVAAAGERVAAATARQANDAARSVDRYDLLTAREREVLRLAAHGLTNAEVGERLSISPRTAETHRANLLRKLGLQTQTDLVRYAVGRGLVPPRG